MLGVETTGWRRGRECGGWETEPGWSEREKRKSFSEIQILGSWNVKYRKWVLLVSQGLEVFWYVTNRDQRTRFCSLKSSREE